MAENKEQYHRRKHRGRQHLEGQSAASGRLPADWRVVPVVRSGVVCLAAWTFFAIAVVASQSVPIAIIDFYGLGSVPEERARSVLTFTEGDMVSFGSGERPAFVGASEMRLATLPGVARARINLVCCDNGGVSVYIGLEGPGPVRMPVRPEPTGDARLPAHIVRAGEEFSKVLTVAVQAGNAAEDRSQGHALSRDPATRALQDRFARYANRDLPALRHVLRRSSSATHRALAVHVLGYADDKAAVVEDLIYGTGDPDQDVRNNAMRALMVIAEMLPRDGRSAPAVPAEPFLQLLHSPLWSDRNKASWALEALTRHRAPDRLAASWRQAISPLAEIARWKSEAHALPGFLVLARLANYADEVAVDLWKRGQRERVIQAAIARQ